MLNAWKIARNMRGMTMQQRFGYLRHLARRSGTFARPSFKWFREIGSNIIRFDVRDLDDAGRLAGGIFHELTHWRQATSLSGWTDDLVRSLQATSAWTLSKMGDFGAITPLYVLNPIEVHAASSALLAPTLRNINLPLLLVSRVENTFLITHPEAIPYAFDRIKSSFSP